MNILYFHVHDQGRYVSTYGYPPRTPHLDRLADRGVTFRNAFCTAPTCSPSRASLLTGQYPHQVGMYGLTNQGWKLDNYDHHLRKYLADQGYQTALIGSHHATHFTDEGYAWLGYDYKTPQQGEDSLQEFRADEAIRYLKQSRDKPFFLALGYDITHHSKWNRSFVHSYSRLGPLDTNRPRPYIGIPDTSETRLEAALQIRATEWQDLQLGRILDTLDELNLTDDTLVLYTTDHGPGLPYAKKNLNDRGTGVSLVMAGPRGFSGGRQFDALVSHLDLFPTFCDLLGAPANHPLEGKSLLPLLRGETETLHDAIFAEQNYHGKAFPFRSIRTQRYRYIRAIGDHPMNIANVTADGGEALDCLRQHGADDRPIPREQLFDLIFDPDENVNLSSDAHYAQIKSDLSQQLDAWMERTNDPARHNKIPPPPPTPAWAQEGAAEKRAWSQRWQAARNRLMGI